MLSKPGKAIVVENVTLEESDEVSCESCSLVELECPGIAEVEVVLDGKTPLGVDTQLWQTTPPV